MKCRSGTGWNGGGYLIFWPPSRLVCVVTHTETSNSPVWPSFAYGYLICHLDSNPGLQPHSIKPHRSKLLSSCTGVHIVSSSVCVYLCLSEWRASVNSWKASFNKSNDRRRVGITVWAGALTRDQFCASCWRLTNCHRTAFNTFLRRNHFSFVR